MTLATHVPSLAPKKRLEPCLVGLDIDGVVADFTGTIERWVWRNHGIEPIPILDWDWFEHWPDGKSVWRDVWNRGCRQEKLLLRCRPIPGAIIGVHELQKMGFEIVFVTHRNDDFAEDTLRWLDKNLLPPIVVHAKDKASAGAALYIDDKPETVRDLLKGNHKAFLFAQDWNLNWQHRLPTFKNWHDAVSKIRGWVGG